MAIQLVVFDMAGTTVKDDGNVQAALQHAFMSKGIEVSRQEVNQVMGYPKPVAIEALLKLRNYLHTNQAFIQSIFFLFQQHMVNLYQSGTGISGTEGVNEVFSTLRAHQIKVAIDTGFDRRIADAIIHRLGWKEQGLIDVSITSDEVEQGRPYPDMIYRAMQLTGISNVENVAKVGDTASDMQQGTAAGCKYVIGVTTGSYTREALQNEPHTHIIDHLSELLAIIGIPSGVPIN